MQRKIFPKYELEWMIAEAFSKQHECTAVRSVEVYWHPADEAGCNWNVNASLGGGQGTLNCQACAVDVIRELRDQYNIVDPE